MIAMVMKGYTYAISSIVGKKSGSLDHYSHCPRANRVRTPFRHHSPHHTVPHFSSSIRRLWLWGTAHPRPGAAATPGLARHGAAGYRLLHCGGMCDTGNLLIPALLSKRPKSHL